MFKNVNDDLVVYKRLLSSKSVQLFDQFQVEKQNQKKKQQKQTLPKRQSHRNQSRQNNYSPLFRVTISVNNLKKSKNQNVLSIKNILKSAQTLKNISKIPIHFALNPSNLKPINSQYKVLQDKMFLISKKMQEMKANILLGKLQKEKIIKEKTQERQKWVRQRHNKLQNQRIEKQKIERIFKFSKLSERKIHISELNKKQSSILKDTVLQIPEPQQIYFFDENPYSENQNFYYVSQAIKAFGNNKALINQHISNSISILKVLNKNSRFPITQNKYKKLNLSKKRQYTNKKVLIFDMDQTLIHCNDTLQKCYDSKIQIKLQNGKIIQAGINIRPYAKNILRNLHKDFQIIIFTASQSCYADEVLKILDQHNQYIQHRLYRQNCFLSSEGIYIKDLRIINRPLQDMILVDNAAYSYFFQIENGIPIVPYYQGKQDFELKALEKYLKELKQHKDVRTLNKKRFKLQKYIRYSSEKVNNLVSDLYIEKENQFSIQSLH